MEAVAHQLARVSRFLVVVTATAEPPKLSREALPDPPARFQLFGDGKAGADWAAVLKLAAEERAGLDARSEPGWVWIGHDQYFYHSQWQFFHCHGPAGWESDTQRASRLSSEELHRRIVARHAAEKAGNAKEAQKRKATGEKKVDRPVDAIVAGLK